MCYFIQANLLQFYKKGTIKFAASPEFGKETKWESLFYKTNKEITIASDGSLFVSNPNQHNIYKFSDTGQYLLKFGRKGQGPADLFFPGDLSILDDKYVVIGEYATTRYISLFTLQGQYFKKIKANSPVYSVVALKNNKIAYLTQINLTEKDYQVRVIIKDVISGEEKVVDEHSIVNKSYIKFGSGGMIKFENLIGEVFIVSTKTGNLLVGVSNTTLIKIYSENGKLIRSFNLDMCPVPVTANYIRDFKKNFFKGSEAMARNMKSVSFEKFFEKNLPYYREILVDSDGNILVFKWLDCVFNCTKIFQVYSPEGQFICETKIDDGIFDFDIDRRFKNILFTSKGIFGLFQLKNSEDISLRIVKINIK